MGHVAQRVFAHPRDRSRSPSVVFVVGELVLVAELARKRVVPLPESAHACAA